MDVSGVCVQGAKCVRRCRLHQGKGNTDLQQQPPAFLPHGVDRCKPLPATPPQARLKFRDDLSIKAFPYPALKIQKRIALPGSDCWGVRLR